MLDDVQSYDAFRRRLTRGGSYADADEFDERYELESNSLVDNASWEGRMFETYGPEEDYVFAAPIDRVWTILDVDGLMWITAGRHWVNRMGYLLSLSPWESATETYLCG